MPRRSTLFLAIALTAAPAFARNVIYVDNSRAGGAGTYDRPFATLAEAQARSVPGDVIYVAEGNAPYEGFVGLRSGQQLIGAAEGLRDDPFIAPVQGPGPTIRGNVWMQGDNVVAGCTIVAEKGVALAAASPSGAIAIRKVFVRAASALSLVECGAPVTIESSDVRGGVAIAGGMSEIVFDRVPVDGAVIIKRRAAGEVKFRNASTINGAIEVDDSKGLIAFDSRLNATGFIVRNVERVEVTGGGARVAGPFEVRDASILATFDRVAGDVTVNHVQGRLVIAEGSGNEVRIEQSSGVQLVQFGVGGSMYLRHVSESKFSAITANIEAHYLHAVVFDNVTASTIALHDVAGDVHLRTCSAQSIVIEQRYGSGRVSIDSLRVVGGGGVRLEVSGNSSLAVDIFQAWAARLGVPFVDGSARDAAKLTVVVRDSHLEFAGDPAPPAVEINAAAGSDACAALQSTATLGAAQPLRLQGAAKSCQ